MKVGEKVTIHLDRKFDGVFYLVPIGDIHRLNAASSDSVLDETVDWIASREHARWIGMGDYADFIGYRDSRFDPTVVDKAVPVCKLGQIGKEGVESVRRSLSPISDQCIGMLEGNHERKYEEYNDCQDLTADMCASMGVQYLTYSCFQELEFVYKRDRYTYTIRAHHGAGYAQTKGGKMNKLKQFAQQTNAEITLMGHLHDIISYPQIELWTDGTRIRERVRLALMTGTFLKTYEQDITTYGEVKAYDPAPLGAPKVGLTPFERKTIGDVIG